MCQCQRVRFPSYTRPNDETGYMCHYKANVFALIFVSLGCAFAQSNLSPQSGTLDTADSNTLTASRYGVAIPQKLPPTEAEQQEVAQNMRDIHFDFDQFYLLPEALSTLQANAQWLRAHPDRFITIEGHADERGSIVYNVVLSDMRARATREGLLGFGVRASQIIFATGWGKLYPLCSESDEACWSQNRRAHFTAW